MADVAARFDGGEIEGMPENDELGIERITETAIDDVATAFAQKIGRQLTADELGGIARIVRTEHFWARAEEMLMFVRFRNADESRKAVEDLGKRYREWRTLQPAEPHDANASTE